MVESVGGYISLFLNLLELFRGLQKVGVDPDIDVRPLTRIFRYFSFPPGSNLTHNDPDRLSHLSGNGSLGVFTVVSSLSPD